MGPNLSDSNNSSGVTDSDSSDYSSDDDDPSPNESICFPQFNDLPPEIKENIICQRPKLIPAFSLVNQELHHLSSRLYLEKVCKRSLRNHEIRAYIRTNPMRFGTHVHSYHSMTSGQAIANVYRRRFREDNIVVMMNFKKSSLSFRKYYHDDIPSYNSLDNVFEYDYLMQYHILSKRLSCVRLNPSYAKDYILHYLDRWYRTITDEPDDQISFYLFLWMNAHVLQITPPPRETFSLGLPDDDSLLDATREETARLYTAIRDAITKLD